MDRRPVVGGAITTEGIWDPREGRLRADNPIRSEQAYLRLGSAVSRRAAGAQSIAASPWVNLAIGAVLVAFGLSLLGLFELRLPNGLANLVWGGTMWLSRPLVIAFTPVLFR